MYNLTGKNVVVVGASSGIGARAAMAYAKAGANVALLARRLEKLQELEKELSALGVQAVSIKCDISDPQAIKEAADKIFEVFPRVDILLNNAGVAVKGDLIELTEEEWDWSFDVNVKGIYLICKYILPSMIENQYGKIVNISSINALISDKLPAFVRQSYNTSKKAVIGLTESMATYYGKHNITVNALGPGFFKTEMTEDSLFKSEKFMSKHNERNPMGRTGGEDEMNGPILFLSSDESSYVNGQFLLVDGGLTLV